MALPRINFGVGQVESLGRYDTGAYARQGAVTANVVENVRDLGTNIAEQFYARRNESELHKMTLDSNTAMLNFKNKSAQKQFYSAEEVEPFLDDAKNLGFDIRMTSARISEDGAEVEEPRQDIPAYEVQPFMYRSFMEKSIPTWLSQISSPRLRAKVEEKLVSQMDSDYTRMLSTMVDKQQAYMRDAVDANMKRALDNDNYAAAMFVVKNSSVISAEEKQDRMSFIEERKESDGYDRVSISRDPDGIREAISFLSREDDTYRKSGGKLEPEERRSYIHRLQSDLDSIERTERAKREASNSIVMGKASQAIDLMRKGMSVSPAMVNNLRANLMSIGTGSALLRLEELDMTDQYSHVFEKIANVSGPVGVKLIDEAMRLSEYQFDELTRKEFGMMLTNANNDKATAVREDMIGYMKKYPHIYGDVTFDVTDLPGSLARAKQIAEVGAHVFQVPKQYLDKNDWDAFKTAFEGSDEDAKLEMLSVVAAEYGDEAQEFFVDGVKKQAGTLAIAGSLYQEGQTLTAKSVIRGANVIEKNSVNLSKINNELDQRVREQLGGAVPDASKYSTYIDAVKYVYANKIWESQRGTQQESIDSNLLRSAVNAVTRGVIEYNGYTIEAPNRGETSHSFKKQMDDLSATHLDNVGGFQRFTSAQVKKGLDSGEFHLVPLGLGTYIIANAGNSPLQAKGARKPFVLDMNRKVFSVDQETALRRANRLEERTKKYGKDRAVLMEKARKDTQRRRQLYGLGF